MKIPQQGRVKLTTRINTNSKPKTIKADTSLMFEDMREKN